VIEMALACMFTAWLAFVVVGLLALMLTNLSQNSAILPSLLSCPEP
jgi:hypothetical protein